MRIKKHLILALGAVFCLGACGSDSEESTGADAGTETETASLTIVDGLPVVGALVAVNAEDGSLVETARTDARGRVTTTMKAGYTWSFIAGYQSLTTMTGLEPGREYSWTARQYGQPALYSARAAAFDGASTYLFSGCGSRIDVDDPTVSGDYADFFIFDDCRADDGSFVASAVAFSDEYIPLAYIAESKALGVGETLDLGNQWQSDFGTVPVALSGFADQADSFYGEITHFAAGYLVGSASYYSSDLEQTGGALPTIPGLGDQAMARVSVRTDHGDEHSTSRHNWLLVDGELALRQDELMEPMGALEVEHSGAELEISWTPSASGDAMSLSYFWDNDGGWGDWRIVGPPSTGRVVYPVLPESFNLVEPTDAGAFAYLSVENVDYGDVDGFDELLEAERLNVLRNPGANYRHVLAGGSYRTSSSTYVRSVPAKLGGDSGVLPEAVRKRLPRSLQR